MFFNALSHYVNPSRTLKILYLLYADTPSACMCLPAFHLLQMPTHIYASVFTRVTVFEIQWTSPLHLNYANVKITNTSLVWKVLAETHRVSHPYLPFFWIESALACLPSIIPALLRTLLTCFPLASPLTLKDRNRLIERLTWKKVAFLLLLSSDQTSLSSRS